MHCPTCFEMCNTYQLKGKKNKCSSRTLHYILECLMVRWVVGSILYGGPFELLLIAGVTKVMVGAILSVG